MTITPLAKAAKALKMRFPGKTISSDLNISKGVVSEYLNGKKELSENFKIAFREFYKIDIDDFDDENSRTIELNAPFEVEYLENNNSNSFIKLENGQYLMTMPLAEFNIQAGFLDHYQDIEYLQGLGKHSILVDKPVKGRYVAFRVKGDSMDSGRADAILQNYVVATRELQRQHWTSKLRFKDFPYWVIYTTEARYPLLKQIVDHDIENACITCHSLNDAPEYSDFTLCLNDVQALFYVIDINRPVAKYDNY